MSDPFTPEQEERIKVLVRQVIRGEVRIDQPISDDSGPLSELIGRELETRQRRLSRKASATGLR